MGVDRRTQATNVSGVFAGGDMTTGTASIIEAIAAGRRAADAINSFLGGNTSNGGTHSSEPGPLLEFNNKYLQKTQRTRSPELPRSERGLDKEDIFSLNLAKADEEAKRCLNCGCVAVNASDMAPALIALAAKIKTTRRSMDADHFFDAGPLSSTVLEAGELVTEIEIPAPRPTTGQVYLKFRTRNSIDFPIVSVAVVIAFEKNKVTGARIVLGAVAPVPIRAHGVEDFLKGRIPTEEVAEAAGAIAVGDSNPLSKNKYKVEIVKTLVKKAILSCSQAKQ
jgi:CO/xanthine dehydrogenase FAD-binding subunit